MLAIWNATGMYRRVEYENEADLESAITEVQKQLLGANRFYLDVKKKIGLKGLIQNIPDGYLLDLSSTKPRLYVVENELQRHDPLRHIAVQILQFSLSFESEPLGLKKVLLSALEQQPEVKSACDEYAVKHDFRNVDHLLEHLVVESPFSALVIIDQMPESLETVLSEKFRFGVEVLELARYQNASGERLYHFDPFLEDVLGEPLTANQNPAVADIDPDEIDTVVVPAREEGFQRVFIGQNRWYAVRIHGMVRPQIKYIAVYQSAPVQAITYLAPVKSIEPWKDTGKVVIYFAEPAHPVGPLHIVKDGRVGPLFNLRYTTHERLLKAKDLDGAFAPVANAAGA